MAKKVVAVQNGLDKLSENLKELGYEVVGIDETEHALDAIVYSTKLSDMPNKIHSNEVNGYNSAVDNDGYVMMINADEFSYDELLNRLNDL